MFLAYRYDNTSRKNEKKVYFYFDNPHIGESLQKGPYGGWMFEAQNATEFKTKGEAINCLSWYYTPETIKHFIEFEEVK